MPTWASATEAPEGAGALTNVDQETAGEILERLDRYDVPDVQQKGLLEKYANGERWDSFDRTAEPVSVEYSMIDGVDYTINRFADGSVHARGLENPSDGARTPDGTITGCTVTSSGDTTFFQNCRVADDHVIVGASFSTNYQMNSATNQASVTVVDRPDVVVAGGSATVPDLTILRRNFVPGLPGMAGDPAIGQLSFTATLPQELGSYHVYLQVRVTPGAAIPMSNFLDIPS